MKAQCSIVHQFTSEEHIKTYREVRLQLKADHGLPNYLLVALQLSDKEMVQAKITHNIHDKTQPKAVTSSKSEQPTDHNAVKPQQHIIPKQTDDTVVKMNEKSVYLITLGTVTQITNLSCFKNNPCLQISALITIMQAAIYLGQKNIKLTQARLYKSDQWNGFKVGWYLASNGPKIQELKKLESKQSQIKPSGGASQDAKFPDKSQKKENSQDKLVEDQITLLYNAVEPTLIPSIAKCLNRIPKREWTTFLKLLEQRLTQESFKDSQKRLTSLQYFTSQIHPVESNKRQQVRILSEGMKTKVTNHFKNDQSKKVTRYQLVMECKLERQDWVKLFQESCLGRKCLMVCMNLPAQKQVIIGYMGMTFEMNPKWGIFGGYLPDKDKSCFIYSTAINEFVKSKNGEKSVGFSWTTGIVFGEKQLSIAANGRYSQSQCGPNYQPAKGKLTKQPQFSIDSIEVYSLHFQ